MLTQRQKKILQAIVRQYTSTGQPVGSKHLAEKLPFKVSSATVRNEMAVLEDNDLILKEHSSSGRIPSKRGYRYYVDNLLDPQAVTDNDLVVIQNSLGSGFQKIDEIISHSADILSNLTSYTAFTLKPEQESVRLSGFRVVPLGNHKVIAILVTDSGEVENPELEEQEKKRAEIQGEQLDIGWGSQIRSYVFHPYSMVKDHRTNFETGNTQAVMDGELDGFINAYLQWKLQKTNPS